jgi:hypothetical protein
MSARRQRNFCFAAKRRQEIVLHAIHVGAAETEDLSRWLIAWSWHNSQSKDPIQSLMWAAERMRRKNFTAADAEAILEEASRTRRHMSADNLARFLGVTYEHRQTLRLSTIGSINVGKQARRVLRKRRDCLAKERKRRAQGARPQSESVSRTRPWEAMKMSRRTWYRRRTKSVLGTSGTDSSAPISLSSDDEFVPETRVRRRREFERPTAAKETSGIRLAKATTLAADIYATLPLELRMAALCLSIPKTWARAA